MQVYEKFHGAAGLIPRFLNESDPESTVTQLDRGYAHGGGWRTFKGFTLTFDREAPLLSFLDYPGDPKTRCYAAISFRDEWVLVFQNSWVAVVAPDHSYQIARMD